MRERPIGILVEALRSLGAEITYLENEGFPPLGIRGTTLNENEVSLPANISSQYISALLLVAPSLKRGLVLNLEGRITSLPYINMTLRLLEEVGVQSEFTGQIIRVFPKAEVEPRDLVVESDWSSASYYYSILSLSPIGSEISLSAYKRDSLQGDSILREIYKNLGIVTQYKDQSIILHKAKPHSISHLVYDLSEAPDLAQTL